MTDIDGTISELAELCPALAAALARDTGGEGGVTGTWTATMVVNADVLAAMIALERGVPAAVRAACEAVSEPWRHRDLGGCLRQVPRLHGRLHDLAMVTEAHDLAWQADGWLRMVKRALGLRRPPLDIGCACPYAADLPEVHAGSAALFAAGDEGFLRRGADGYCVEWVHTPVIYCAGCDASWPRDQWGQLGRMLETAAMAAT